MDLEGKILVSWKEVFNCMDEPVKKEIYSFDKLKKLNNYSDTSLDIHVSCKEHIRIGSDFLPRDFVEVHEIEHELTRLKNGAIMYDGELVHTLFDSYYAGILVGQDQYEEQFAVVCRSVGYDINGHVTSDGRPYNVVVDSAIKARNPDCQHLLLSSVKNKVVSVMEYTGKNPSLTFPAMRLYVPSESIVDFVRDVEQSEKESGKKAKSPYVEFIF